jgi:hypothetical protein
LSSLHTIKLPLYSSQSLKEKDFQAVPPTTLMVIKRESPSDIASEESSKSSKVPMQPTPTEDYCSKYGEEVEVVLRREKEEARRGTFLSKHKIDGMLRARMLDWMVEVMSSYNFQNKTYFAGIEIMDAFFANCSEVLVPSQLHIVGVAAMFIATKMEEVYPLKMSTVYDKITHKKISIKELISMEHKLAETLNFEFVTSSFYELAVAKIANYLTLNNSYCQTVLKEMEEVSCCLAKFMAYNY